MLISDLHIHSRFARACSKDISIKKLEEHARLKGIDLLGTGDAQHPQWIQELKRELSEDGTGILRTKTGYPFMLQTEISLMYSDGGRGRKVHFVVLAPDFATVDQMTAEFLKKGRIDYDGRPIFGYTTPEFIERLRSINPWIEIIPAHAWTPYFGIFGSKSGFDSVEECAQDQAKHIHAIETGISSDPAMNWRVSKLDKYGLVSFSDIHSYHTWRLGRECTVFDTKMEYKAIIQSLRDKRIHSTIETDPAYGKYHFDGHMDCKLSFSPQESIKMKDLCPRCGKMLNIGVQHRVDELADRPEGYVKPGAPPYVRLIPLMELIAAVNGCGVATNKTYKAYHELVKPFGSEFKTMLEAPEEELRKLTTPEMADAMMANRKGTIEIIPGYDGQYGIPLIGRNLDLPKQQPFKARKEQKGIGDFL